MRATDALLPDQPGNPWVILNTRRMTCVHDSGLGKPWSTQNEKQAKLFAEEYTTKTRELCIAVRTKEAFDTIIKHDPGKRN